MANNFSFKLIIIIIVGEKYTCNMFPQ